MKNIATKEIIGALRGCSEALSDEACEKMRICRRKAGLRFSADAGGRGQAGGAGGFPLAARGKRLRGRPEQLAERRKCVCP